MRLIVPFGCLLLCSCAGTLKRETAQFQVYLPDGKAAGSGMYVETNQIIRPSGFFKFGHFNGELTNESGVATLSHLRDGELVIASDQKRSLSASTNYHLGQDYYELRLKKSQAGNEAPFVLD